LLVAQAWVQQFLAEAMAHKFILAIPVETIPSGSIIALASLGPKI
jgi:hypothetical protein